MAAGHFAAGFATRHFGAAGGQPALALHCSLAHSGAWGRLAAELPFLQIIAPDMPGHGAAADWDGHCNQHDLAARSAIDLMRSEGGAPRHLIGHSFGAVTALRIAQTAPGLVRSLTLFEPVLFCAAKGTAEFSAYLADSQAFETALSAGKREDAAAAFHAVWGQGQGFHDLPPALQQYFQDRIHLISGQNDSLRDDALGLLPPGQLEAIRAPVLLVQGAASPPIIDRINQALARRLPLVSRASIAGAGHMLPITHAPECGAQVQAFLLGESVYSA